ncbi:MAG: NAD(P)-dependent alcohol dehydrogenase [Acidobacteriota bacterium]
MKCITLGARGGLDRMTVTDRPDPGPPGPREVRVRLHASSLNFHDYKVVTGDRPHTEGLIPMADGAGVVESAGEAVSEFAAGDHVVSTFFPGWLEGPPPFADFKTVPGDGVDGYARDVVVAAASAFTRAPKGWSHLEAATLTTAGVTAWRALVADAGLKAGDTILVLGTGGVSIVALQIATAMGATAIVTSSSDSKLERARALGAAHTINYRSEPEWGAEVRRLTSGRGVDHVLEMGGPGTLAQSITAVRTGGHISLIGTLTGTAGPVPTAAMMVKQIRLQGVIVGSRRHQMDLVRALDTTGIHPVIDRTFAFEALADAFRHEESGAHFGKIAVEY